MFRTRVKKPWTKLNPINTGECHEGRGIKKIQAVFSHAVSFSHPKGLLRLRNALSTSYKKEFNGRELDPETNIVITAGANEGIFAVMAGFLDKGDEVIVMEPFFDQYIVSGSII